MKTRNVYIVGGARIPFMKSMTAYRDVSSEELMTASLKSLVDRYNLEGKTVGDVALGAVMHSSANWNLAREVVQSSGLHPNTPAYNVQRACGTSLENTIQIAHKISSHQIESGIAGGVDSNSDLPIMVSRTFARKLIALNSARTLGEKVKIILGIKPSDLKPVLPAVVEPRTGKSMGEHCELMVKEWNISRQEQDELALASHRNAAQAYKDGFYDDLVFPFQGNKTDGILRADTTLEKLSKLKPVFDKTKLFVEVSSANEALEVIKFAQDLELKNIVLIGNAVLVPVLDEIKKSNFPLIITRVHSLPLDNSMSPRLPYQFAKMVADKGILYGLDYSGDHEYQDSRNLPFLAGTTAAYGVEKEKALQSISYNLAKILGIENRFGSLEVGKSATLFISDGDALKKNSIIGTKQNIHLNNC